MKITSSILTVCCLFFSCSTNNALFEVEMISQFTIPLGLNTLETHCFIENNIPATLETQIENFNLSNDEVTQVVASGAILSPRFGDNINLEFIQSVNVFIVDPFNFNDRREIFFRENIEFGSRNRIQLFSTISNVKEELLANNIRIETCLKFRQFPPQTFDVLLDMSFSVFIE